MRHLVGGTLAVVFRFAGFTALLIGACLLATVTAREARAQTGSADSGGAASGFFASAGIRAESGTFSFNGNGGGFSRSQIAVHSGASIKRPTSGSATVQASEVAVGGGYQWRLNPGWTASATVEGFRGSLSGDLDGLYDVVSGTGVGFEVRDWFSPRAYLGGALRYQRETLTPAGHAGRVFHLSEAASSAGVGLGLVAGWALGRSSTIDASLDVGRPVFANADYGYGALRLSWSYHWR